MKSLKTLLWTVLLAMAMDSLAGNGSQRTTAGRAHGGREH